MGNLSSRIKRLDIQPARALSYEERDTYGLKYLSRSSRVFGKIPYHIILPAFYYTNLTKPTIQYYPRRIVHYPVTMPEDFLILNTDIVNPLELYIANVFITVKWLNDSNEVQRYLVVGDSKINSDYPTYAWTKITNQLVAPNCVFEVWCKQDGANIGLINNITIKTSVIRNPTSADEISENVDIDDTLEMSEVSVVLPQALPIVWP